MTGLRLITEFSSLMDSIVMTFDTTFPPATNTKLSYFMHFHRKCYHIDSHRRLDELKFKDLRNKMGTTCQHVDWKQKTQTQIDTLTTHTHTHTTHHTHRVHPSPPPPQQKKKSFNLCIKEPWNLISSFYPHLSCSVQFSLSRNLVPIVSLLYYVLSRSESSMI